MELLKLIEENAPLIMGIINCTPDSFFEDSRISAVDEALETARQMVHDGALILDIGGESSRPGSSYVSAKEEIHRVIPVIRAIRQAMDIPISIDTRKKAVAEAAVEAGADIINDISSLHDDPEMALYAAKMNIPVILMHMKGTPESMQDEPYYDDVVTAVKVKLKKAADSALNSGIKKDNIILDPGIGFGKRQEDNIDLLKAIPQLKELGYPLLIGLSRKKFIGNITEQDTENRLAGTLAANAFSMIKGAQILRVHDVRETVDMVKVMRELI